MDVSKLIRSVYEREPLWDRKHAYYHDRTVTMALWEDVAYSLNVDSETVRTKWKGLRDTFRGELRKLHRTRILGKPRKSTNWEYFDKMLFVKDQIYSYQRHHAEIKRRREKMAAQQQPCNSDDSNDCNPVKSEINLQDDLSSHSPLEIDIEPVVKVEPIDREEETKSPVNIEAKTLENYAASSNGQKSTPEVTKTIEKAIEDDDFNFLMSLLPQLKCLPTTRNLFVRLKIQELLYNEIVSASPTVLSI